MVLPGESGIDTIFSDQITMTYLIIGIIAIPAVIAAVIFLKKARGKNHKPAASSDTGFPHGQPAGSRDSTSESKNIELVKGKASLAQSLEALAGKYSCGTVIIATADGLLLASHGTETASLDAAKYSEIYSKNPLAGMPGVFMFGIEHKGSPVVGIIMTDNTLSRERELEVKSDTKDILNWWI